MLYMGMTYSVDLRERAVGYVLSGGSQAEASRVYSVSTRTLFNWLRAEDLRPKVCGPRQRKLDKAALAAHVREYPDALLRERATHFGVSTQAIWYALRAMGVRKKNNEVR